MISRLARTSYRPLPCGIAPTSTIAKRRRSLPPEDGKLGRLLTVAEGPSFGFTVGVAAVEKGFGTASSSELGEYSDREEVADFVDIRLRGVRVLMLVDSACTTVSGGGVYTTPASSD